MSYELTVNKNQVLEGESFVITLTTTGIADGTVIPYTITGVSAGDITPSSLTGSFTITGGTDSVTYTAVNDGIADEGNETFVLTLDSIAESVSVVIAETVPLPTSANRTCIAVIDEASSFVDPAGDWNNFRTNWPDRPFYLLQPLPTNYGGGDLKVPAAFTNDPIAYGPITVNRDGATPPSDWYEICDLDSLPDGSALALFIDTSGSMTLSNVQDSYNLFISKITARNMSIIEVFNGNENWVVPFNTILDDP